MEPYKVRQIGHAPRIEVTVPGSKSITNRALLMAAMAQGETVLEGVLFSDDSRVFLKALQELGFAVDIDETNCQVRIKGMGGKIPRKEAEIYVGSAGTAARFLTAFTAMSDGCYRLEASEQMKKRPMKELFDALCALGVKIRFLAQEDTFPIEICGIARGQGEGRSFEKVQTVSLNIDRSSQFLSALLMTAPLQLHQLTIRLTGSRSARSYVEMTKQMMCQFGHSGVQMLQEDVYRVCGQAYEAGTYCVEPDVSAACYFYAMAAITGGTAQVDHMKKDSLQGDMRFLALLEQMGCRLTWDRGECLLTGVKPGQLKGIDADLGDFSDQALTLAAIAPYANSPVTIRNIGHIRGQECDRIRAIAENMKRMGIRCSEQQDSIRIEPGQPQPARIETYDDHRVAMAFAVTGIRAEGIQILNPSCCKKTFEQYFSVLDRILRENQ